MIEWTEVNQSWKKFWKQAKPGMVIEIRHEDGQTERLLIGDINALGGICDDCTYGGIDDATVTRLFFIAPWNNTPPAEAKEGS